MLEVRPSGLSIMSVRMPLTDDTAIARIDRLIRFATDTLDLADRRGDLDLRANWRRSYDP